MARSLMNGHAVVDDVRYSADGVVEASTGGRETQQRLAVSLISRRIQGF